MVIGKQSIGESAARAADLGFTWRGFPKTGRARVQKQKNPEAEGRLSMCGEELWACIGTPDNSDLNNTLGLTIKRSVSGQDGSKFLLTGR